jgi:hypothetical protein
MAGGTSVAWNMLHWNMESFELFFKFQIMLSFFIAFIFITNLNKAENIVPPKI